MVSHNKASLLVVDHVEDPHNLGAIVRSAVAAGIPRLVVSARRGAPMSGATFKAAAGALEHCSVAVVGSIADAIKRLSDLAVWTVGLDADGDRSLFGLELFTEPSAIVDLATLTGSCMMALGHWATGLFGNSDALIETVRGLLDVDGARV